MNCAFLTVCHDEDGDGKNGAGDSSRGDYDSYCITVMIMRIAMVVMKIKLLITVVVI